MAFVISLNMSLMPLLNDFVPVAIASRLFIHAELIELIVLSKVDLAKSA